MPLAQEILPSSEERSDEPNQTEAIRSNPNLSEAEVARPSGPDALARVPALALDPSELVGTARRSGPQSDVIACLSEPLPSLTSLASVNNCSCTTDEPNPTEPNRGNSNNSEGSINYQPSTKSQVEDPNSESEAEKLQVASVSSQSKIANQKSKILEHCLECDHPLPALLPNGTRPAKRCDYCNFPLPPAGTCCEPSIEQCPNCRANLPRLLPNGQHPDIYCHNCTISLL